MVYMAHMSDGGGFHVHGKGRKREADLLAAQVGYKGFAGCPSAPELVITGKNGAGSPSPTHMIPTFTGIPPLVLPVTGCIKYGFC